MLHFDSWVWSKEGSTGLKKLAYAFGLDCPKEVLGELNVYDALSTENTNFFTITAKLMLK